MRASKTKNEFLNHGYLALENGALATNENSQILGAKKRIFANLNFFFFQESLARSAK